MGNSASTETVAQQPGQRDAGESKGNGRSERVEPSKVRTPGVFALGKIRRAGFSAEVGCFYKKKIISKAESNRHRRV